MIQTIVLPSDFSETAMHSGVYALELAKELNAQKVVVYHTYEPVDTTEPMQDYGQTISIEPSRQESLEKLSEFVEALRAKTGTSLTIDAYHSYAELPVAVNEIATTTDAQLIVMGITGGGKLKEVVVGSHSVTIAKEINTLPVLIVPTEASYKKIEKILLVSDLTDVEETTPSVAIKAFLDSTKAELHVLNVTEDEAAASSGKQQLNDVLAGCNPVFHFATNTDFNEAVDSFVASNSIDLVIVIPKKHGIFESLFSASHTKTLAFHSKVPVMAAHK